MQLGDRIRIARKTRGLTQKELAERVNTTQTTISDYERSNRGKQKPDSVLMIRLSKVLNVSLDWLFLGEGHSPLSTKTVDKPGDKKRRA